jgi:hypothetical protein
VTFVEYEFVESWFVQSGFSLVSRYCGGRFKLFRIVILNERSFGNGFLSVDWNAVERSSSNSFLLLTGDVKIARGFLKTV